ncbi:importin subunit beta-1-like [Dorcoceras hygrometricum]|uniref:Importin subunit beta-1-like n=1 Tax=Dorcoceras hygrometricum TaxID=472368 RepID=A0A2Z7DFF0_9LAMI|nr:importin subunit beta-1-like [Dorcoceras hygrometricum]
MFTLKAAKGCSIVPRIHKFYLTKFEQGTAALTTRNQKLSRSSPSSFCSFKWVAIEREVHKEPSATENTQNFDGERRKSREESLVATTRRNNPDATIQMQRSRCNDQTQKSRRNDPDAKIQSQGAKLKAGRFLTTGTRRKHHNAAFQLIRTTSRCSLEWFLKSTAGHPVATYKTRRLTKSNDVTAPTSSNPVDA